MKTTADLASPMIHFPRKWPRRLAVLAVLGQLALVSTGATGFGVPGLGVFGKVLRYYAKLSGASSTYGFFAPGIDGDLRVLFDLVDAKGRIRTVPFESRTSHEAQLRVVDIVGQFDSSSDDDDVDDEEGDGDEDDGLKLGRQLAASLAGTAFGRYPDAKKVVVRLEELVPASMDEYRAGQRPAWSPVYAAGFVRKARR